MQNLEISNNKIFIIRNQKVMFDFDLVDKIDKKD
jgi:hypothetical protein